MLLRGLLLVLLATRAAAHINLLFPLPLNSKNDPQTPEAKKDYSMTAPLDKTGANYPAKGYATSETVDALKPVATLVAGEDFTWTTEDGGSCQVGISYDMLKTVAIMASWIGGCPLEGKYTFKVPDIPGADKALFWWSWFNRTGNREMYNNAAVLAVSSSATSFTGPQPFRANTFSDGTCVTSEGIDLVFENPGEQVIYGGEYAGKTPAATTVEGCSSDTSDVTVTSDGSSAEAPAATEGGDATTAAATGGAGGTATGGGGEGTATGGGEGTATGEATAAGTGAAPSASGGAGGESGAASGASKPASATGAAGGGTGAAAATTKSATGGAATGAAGGTAPTAAGGSAPSSTGSTSADTDSSTGLSTKEIGIAVGAAVVVALLIVLIICATKKRRGGGRRDDSSDDDGEGGGRRSRKKHSHARPSRKSYKKTRKEDTETESSATGSEETDESSDDEKGRRRRR